MGWCGVGLSVLAGVCGQALLSSTVSAAPVYNPDNGHAYEVILQPGVTWTEADLAARALPGGWHLATITSASENAFVKGLIGPGSPYFETSCLVSNLVGRVCGGIWLGGVRSTQGWRWTTGEPFGFSEWGPFEPFGNGDRLRIDEFRDRGLIAWNDVPASFTRSTGYVIENDSPPGPMPQDVAIGFAPSHGLGLQLLRPDSTWQRLHPFSPEAMASGDLDGNGVDDLVVDFGSAYGVWVWMNHVTWVHLHGFSPILMVIGDLDRNGRDDVITTFAGYGVWIWLNNTTWIQLHSVDAVQLAVGNIDGAGGDDVLIDFPVYGIWVYSNFSTWTLLHSLNASTIRTADLDGSGRDDVIIDFPGHGLWIWRNNTTWVPLHPLSAIEVAAGDIDGDGRSDLVINFGPGFGVWIWRNGTTWQPLHGRSPEGLLLADRDGNGKDEVIVDFGPAFGLWQYANDSQWGPLLSLSPEIMVSGRFQ